MNSPGQLGRTRLFSRCFRTWPPCPATSVLFVALGRRRAVQGTLSAGSLLAGCGTCLGINHLLLQTPCAPGMLPPCRGLMWAGASGHGPRRALCPSGSRWRGESTESELSSLGKLPACIPWGRAEEFSLIIIRIKAKGARLTLALFSQVPTMDPAQGPALGCSWESCLVQELAVGQAGLL